MIEQPSSQNQNGQQSGKFRFSSKLGSLAQRSWFRYTVVLFLIFIIAILGLVVLNKLSPEKQNPDSSIADQQSLERVQELETALKNDTVGGKTPEETIQLFLAALKAGDMNQAAQYFAIDTNERSVYYLTRQQWIDALNYKQEKREIAPIITFLENAKYNEGGSSNILETASFVSRDKNGNVDHEIFLSLNKYSNVWKIESL